MRRERAGKWLAAAALAVLFACTSPGFARAGAELSGVVRMPEVCAPSVSPAVVYLTPVGHTDRRQTNTLGESANRTTSTEIALVNQRGLQFTPRVRAIAL